MKFLFESLNKNIILDSSMSMLYLTPELNLSYMYLEKPSYTVVDQCAAARPCADGG
jgi:hypothetical protein